MTDVIQLFLNGRKLKWLEKKLKPGLTESEKKRYLAEADEKFDAENWLPSAARRAKQLNLCTHPVKFSHPNVDKKATAIVFKGQHANDGFLRSGNIAVEPDFAVLNAGAMDVYKFLSLTLEDGQSVLKHLQQNTSDIQAALTIKSMSYADLAEGFLAIQPSDAEAVTDPRIKQVYFPLNTAPAEKTDYHLLSVLTPSGIIFELKERIENMRFSEETKTAREKIKAGEAHPTGFKEILGLTIIGYGGAKPQNISVANSENNGKAYLLPSLPPQIKKRNVRWPRQDFFKESLGLRSFRQEFLDLHHIFSNPRNNFEIRNERDQIFLTILDRVVDVSWSLRAEKAGWSERKHYSLLPKHQKIWLDDLHLNIRHETDSWMEQVVDALMAWIIQGYENTIKSKNKTPFYLINEEKYALKNMLLVKHQEALR